MDANAEKILQGALSGQADIISIARATGSLLSSFAGWADGARAVVRCAEALFPELADNVTRSSKRLTLKRITKAKDLRAYLKVCPAHVNEAYVVAAGKMSVKLLSVVQEFANIGGFLWREVPLLQDEVDEKVTVGSILHLERGIFTLPELAAKEGCIDVVTFLLDLPGFEVDFFCDAHGRADMLRMACSHKKIDVVRLIISRGPDLSPAREVEGHTVAAYAVRGGSVEIVDCLYLAGVSFENCLTFGINSVEVLIRLFDLGFLRLTENDRIIESLTEGTFYEEPFAFLYRTHKKLVERGEGGDKFLTHFLEACRVQKRFNIMVVCHNYFLGQEDVDAETVAFLRGYDIPEVKDHSLAQNSIRERRTRRLVKVSSSFTPVVPREEDEEEEGYEVDDYFDQ
jgi:hypothetical protein